MPSLPDLSRRKFLVGAAGTAAVASVPLLAAEQAHADAPAPLNLSVQDTNTAIKYSGAWQRFGNLNTTYWAGGHATSSPNKGASFEFAHPHCTQLRWHSTKGADRGIARVYVDGAFVTTVDTYAAGIQSQSVVFDSGVLPAGPHVLSVEVTGRKNGSSSNTWIECNVLEAATVPGDPFTVDDTYPTVGFTGTWTATTIKSAGLPDRTVHYTNTAGASMLFAHPYCSQLKIWASTGLNRGQADIYLDGNQVATVDQYSSPAQLPAVTFDTGALTPGPHAIKIVVTGAKQSAAQAAYIEIDNLEVDGDTQALERFHATSQRVVQETQITLPATSSWAAVAAPGAVAGTALSSAAQGSAVSFSFAGDTVIVLGGKQVGAGKAEFWLDGVLQATVDTYAASTVWSQQLFSKTGLAADGMHTLRIVVTGSSNKNATGAAIFLEAFDTTKGVDLAGTLSAQAKAELALISAGTKPYLARGTWRPVAYAATAPLNLVTLQGSGPLNSCFTNNIAYLNACMGYASPNHVSTDTLWTNNWPAANEGRLLAGAGHTLRWGERSDMRAIVTAMVGAAKSRQQANGDGYCMPYAESAITPPTGANDNERPNYDRAMWTRGMVAAIMAGPDPASPSDTTAQDVLRGHYDWFNNWGYKNLGQLVSGSLGLQGHVGSTLTYFSPVGKPADLEIAEQYYVQDWWLEQMREQQPASIANYPLNRPHSYDIIAMEAYLDHYRGTGAQKYLDAVLGGWQIIRQYFTYNGNGTSITEGQYFAPSSAHLEQPNNEGCGSVFWVDLNHRLHQLFPDQEKYVAEIERYLFNVCLAQQDTAAPYAIRYHARYDGIKEYPSTISTCDEVTMTGLYGRLPQYIYSIAADGGLWINLYESSTIRWGSSGGNLLTTTTEFPVKPDVQHTLTLNGPTTMTIRVRVPGWAAATVPIKVNGSVVATGNPGTYVALNRTWSSGDAISYSLPMAFMQQQYTGVTQFNGVQRYCLQYGPVLMALTTPASTGYSWTKASKQSDGIYVPQLSMAPANLLGALSRPDPTKLAFNVANTPYSYQPYWTRPGAVPFSCFPIVAP